MSFEDLGLDPSILKGVHDLGFARPTPVQAEAIPAIIAGRDVIASAATGTGKTAAFLLPILSRLLPDGARRDPRALVVSPTRELTQQTQDHMVALSRHTGLRGCSIYGGVDFAPQVRALRTGVDVVAATPGRLLDHVERQQIKLSSVQILVLDEADRMLDMGFLPDIRRILALLPRQRQNLIFSATIPAEIGGLVQTICHDPVRVQIGGNTVKVPAGIRHAVYPVIHEQKLEMLLRLMREMGKGFSLLVFTRTKERADRLAELLHKSGFSSAVLHGDRTQSERAAALEAFRRGEHQVMVATDVAARGLDIDDITHVINYDIPEEPENYIHRIGRTGRAEAEGDAFTLMAPAEEGWILAVERLLGQRLPRITLPDFEYRTSTVAGSYHPRPHYIKSLRPGEKPRGFGGRGGGGGGRGRR